MTATKPTPVRRPKGRQTAQGGSLEFRASKAPGKTAALLISVAPDVVQALSKNRVLFKKLAEAFTVAMRQDGLGQKVHGFKVEVDRRGRHRIAPLSPSRGKAAPAGKVETDAEAIEAARERGRARIVEILQQDDMLTAEAFGARLGVSHVTVHARRQKNEVLALDGAKRGFRFPAWQIDRDGKPFPDLPRLFELLGPSPWGVYRFLTQRHDALGGSTAKDLLRRGGREAVLEAAESLARGDFS